MTTYTDYYRHTNSTDTLYAVPLTVDAWSITGLVDGDDSQVAGLFVFEGLDDETAYEIRIRAGAGPLETDVSIAAFSALANVPTAAEISFSIANDVVNDDNDWDIAKQSLVGQIWENTDRTLTSIADSTGMTTLLTRITGLLQTKAQADTDQAEVISAVDNVPTTEQVEEIATYSKIAAKNTQE